MISAKVFLSAGIQKKASFNLSPLESFVFESKFEKVNKNKVAFDALGYALQVHMLKELSHDHNTAYRNQRR